MALSVVFNRSKVMGRGTLTCILLCTIVLRCYPAFAAPAPSDYYGPACRNFPLPDPPPGGFQLWSSPATWGGGAIPGVGSQAGRSVTIGCGKSVLLDVANLTIDILDIQGHLKVKDDGRTNYQVQANSVLVQGQLTIGSAARSFQSKITFTLTNTTGRNLVLTRAPLSGRYTEGDFGTKAFVVVGGQVKLYGMPNASPSWVKLSTTAKMGDASIQVNTDVRLWPVGGMIAIASTDFDYRQAEERIITRIDGGSSWSKIYLDKPLEYMHWGGRVGTPLAGKSVDESAEVALLTRNIKIQGSQSYPPLNANWKGNLKWIGYGNIPENTIRHMSKTNQNQCQMVCSMIYPGSCGGFIYKASTGECWLKPNVVTARYVKDRSMVMFQVTNPFTTPLTVPAFTRAQSGLDFKYYTFATFTGTPAGDCAKLCYAAASVWSPCAGFQMEPDGTTCVLKSQMEVGFLKPRAGVQAYVPRSLVEGGHFMVFHTSVPGGQHIEGVEFSNMGQQGILGRYPVHFHFGKEDDVSVVNKCAVHHSSQRCYVTHGTTHLTFSNNVAYKNKGHCFITEEGFETRNKFTGNLAMLSEPVALKIKTTEIGTLQSDEQPTSFWMTNADNDFVNNVAAGAAKGFWFQLTDEVRGGCASLPGANKISPANSSLGLFTGNVAHSNYEGFTLYPPGHRSHTVNTIVNLRAFKNRRGAFMHGLDGLMRTILSGCVFADNSEAGVDILEGDGKVSVVDSIFIGETENTGTPMLSACAKTDVMTGCRPKTGCTMPTPLTNARAMPVANKYTVQAGITMTMISGSGGNFRGTPNLITGCSFAALKPACNRPAAAFYLSSARFKEWFNAANTVTKVTIANDGTSAFYIEPQVLSGPYVVQPGNNGPFALSYAVRDADGSITGGGGGYIIASNTAMAASYRTKPGAVCFASPKVINGLVCPGTCYRTVLFRWFVTPYLRKFAPSVKLTRVSDGVSTTFLALPPTWSSTFITTYMNLLAGQVYVVTFVAGTPSTFAIKYLEGGASCAQGLVFRFAAPGPGAIWNLADVNKPWTVQYSNSLSPTCGAPAAKQTSPVTTSGTWACQNGAAIFDLAIAPNLAKFDSEIYLTRTGSAAYPCNCNGRGYVPTNPPATPLPTVKWTMSPPTNVRLTITHGSSVLFWWGDALPHSLLGSEYIVKGPGAKTDVRAAPFSTSIMFPYKGTWNVTCGVYQKRMVATITIR